MSDYQLQSSKLHIETEFNSNGVIGSIGGYKLYGELSLVVDIIDCNTDNSVRIEGKLSGSKYWTVIKTIKGSVNVSNIDISNYDYIRFNTLKYSNSVNTIPKIIASGYYSQPVSTENTDLLQTNNKILSNILYAVCESNELIKELIIHMSIITDEEEI